MGIAKVDSALPLGGASPPSALTPFAEHPPIVGDGLPHTPLVHRNLKNYCNGALGVNLEPFAVDEYIFKRLAFPA